MFNPDDLLEAVCALGRETGKRVLEVYQSGDLGVRYKPDKSPVTNGDLLAHAIICERLAQLTPGLPILSEENSEDIPFAERVKWNSYWLVDPLDGTRGFIRRNGFFSVNIALIENHRPILGVVHIPVDDTLYYARKDGGAWKQEREQDARAITVRKTIDGPPILVASRRHTNHPTQTMVDTLGAELLRLDGSLKLCVVAEGRADLYMRLGPTCEWDTAATQCLVEEAGGFLTDASETALEYNRKDSLINPGFVVHTKASPAWQELINSEEE